jgi:arylsulfatase A-like enzyme
MNQILASLLLISASLAAKPRNVVFLFSDDHALSAISAYGPSHLSGFARTPNIDRLAKEGTLFRHCFVHNSICTPSRAGILTGRHSHRNGVYTLGDSIDPKRRHLAHFFQDAGYRTAIFGKWHLQSQPQGFDTWEVFRNQGEYINPFYLSAEHPQGKREQGYSEDVSTQKALDWLGRRDPAKPFLLCLNFKAPHRNWIPAPRYAERFAKETIPEPATLMDDQQGRSLALTRNSQTIGRDFSLGPDLKLRPPAGLKGPELRLWALRELGKRHGGLSEAQAAAITTFDPALYRRWSYQQYAKDYINTAQAIDDNVGRVLDWLKANGLEEDTIVVYSSDQGFYVGEHGMYDKRWMYEESQHMPLLVRAPGVAKPGMVTKAFAMNLDFAPTLLELCGIAPPTQEAERFDGRSLVPLLRGETPSDWRDLVYYRYWEHNSGEHPVPGCYGIRTATHKLIHYHGQPLGMKAANPKPTAPEWELFDLVKDPQEMRSVYHDPAYAKVREELKARLAAERARIGDSR